MADIGTDAAARAQSSRGFCALARTDSAADEERVLPRAQLRGPREGELAGARPRDEDPDGAGDLHARRRRRSAARSTTSPSTARSTQQVDWEVELGVVIGTTGRNIARADALAHVFGYTVINDLSARDLQQQHLQWFKGKSLDGFCPMGPVVVTADEFGDPQNKRLQLRVNGVTKQDGTTRRT